jgi:hypothetical protein
MHTMSEQWMDWKTIATAPTHGKQILVGFQGQFEWFSYVAYAFGNNTGKHTQCAAPTHWTEIVPPQGVAP